MKSTIQHTIFKTASLLLTFAGILLMSAPGVAIEIGSTLENVTLRDADNNPAPLPDFGEKVLYIVYADAEARNTHDPLSDKIKAAQPDKNHFRPIAIVNLFDSMGPNFLIRKIAAGKAEKYDCALMTDPDRTLIKTWNLGDCNNQSVVLVIGKDKKVKYFQKGPIAENGIDAAASLILSTPEF